jgi:hypothetical protein
VRIVSSAEDGIIMVRSTKRTAANKKQPFEGRWRITDSSNWSAEDLDLVGPAYIVFERGGSGEMQLVAMEATLDHRVSQRDGDWLLEFSWLGFDEGDEVSGRGSVRIDGEVLKGELFIHQGDSSTFVAKRED